MSREILLDSARALSAPSPEAADTFTTATPAIAAELNRRMGRRTDIETLIGPGNQSMMENNSWNFLRFMSTMFLHYHPEVLVDTALWAFRTYRTHGFQVIYWPANIDTTLEIVRERLPSGVVAEIEPFFIWLIINIPQFEAETQSATKPLDPTD